jgi:hypothetical protein
MILFIKRIVRVHHGKSLQSIITAQFILFLHVIHTSILQVERQLIWLVVFINKSKKTLYSDL